MGLPVIRKNQRRDALNATPKDLINTANVKNHEAKAKNVFLGVDNNPIIPYIEMSRTIVVKLLTMTGL